MGMAETIIAGLIVAGICWLFKAYGIPKFIRSRFLTGSTERNSTAPIASETNSGSLEFLNFLNPVQLVRSYRIRRETKKNKEDKRLYQSMKQSTVFFAERFSEAFPGCREIQEFNKPREAIHRLDILLKTPLSVRIENQGMTPIRWFRGMLSLDINFYERKKRCFGGAPEFILNYEHHKLKKIIAVPHQSYFRQFIYVEVEGMKPTGLYDLQYQLDEKGYAVEEYGEYGKLFIKRISREDFDDGATIVNGKVKDLIGKVRARSRYIGKYNFLIAASASPINQSYAEQPIGKILNRMLKGEASINELSEFIFQLPKNRMDQ